MWCPEGYVSWNDVVNEVFELAEKILCEVSASKSLVAYEDGPTTPRHIHSASYYLIRGGFAEDYAEADFIVGLTATYLLSHFLEHFPPLLANIAGPIIQASPEVFLHKDRLDLCTYSWPIRSDPQFQALFTYAKEGRISTKTLLDRFAFIDPISGQICRKNGDINFLANFTSMDEMDAYRLAEFVRNVSESVVCWPAFPDSNDIRDFLDGLGWDEKISAKLNDVLGGETDSPTTGEKLMRGRPDKKAAAAKVYFDIFPDGHEACGKTWKQALQEVESRLGRSVSEVTLKRGVGQLRGRAPQ